MYHWFWISAILVIGSLVIIQSLLLCGVLLFVIFSVYACLYYGSFQNISAPSSEMSDSDDAEPHVQSENDDSHNTSSPETRSTAANESKLP